MSSRLANRWAALSLLIAAVFTQPALADALTSGNLAVVVVDSTTAVSLREYKVDGTQAQSPITLPATGTSAFTLSATASSEGALAMSPDGRFLGLAGYRTGTNTSGTDRVVARVDVATGTVDTSTSMPNTEAYMGNNIRGAVWNGDQYYTSGTNANGTPVSTAGIRTGTFGTTGGSIQLSSTVTNTRTVNIFNNQLYTATMSGAFRGVNTVGTGIPTTSGQTTTLLPGFDPSGTSVQSVYAFVFADANTLYVADDRTTGVGGIQKWTFNGSTWSLAYSTLLGATGGGARGLTLGPGGTLYATTTEASQNRIVSVMDTGTAFSAFSLVATADTGTAFRGLAIVPEPAGILLGTLASIGFAGAAVRRYRKRAVIA